jgi:Putative motility protein
MDIDSVSNYSIGSVEQAAGIKVLKGALDNQKANLDKLLDSIKIPGIGEKIDVKV